MPYPYYADSSWLIYVLPAMLLAMWAQWKVKSTYRMYRDVSNAQNLTGYQVARMILDRNNLEDVVIERAQGELSDHYDPRSRVVRLSPDVYGGISISSMSIAAHEVGHALQHAQGYVPLRFRSVLAPIVGFSQNFIWVFIMFGIMISPFFIDLAIMIFAGALLFQVVTLPVEFNASRRALVQLEDGIAQESELVESQEVLRAAALTYVAATLMSLGELMRLLTITGRRNNNNN